MHRRFGHLEALRVWARLGLVSLATAAALLGCEEETNGGLQEVQPFSCAANERRPGPDETNCAGDERYAKGQCVPARCDVGDVGCCPGMVCTPGGICRIPPRFAEECSSDSDCEVEGQRCMERPLVSAEHKTCGFPPPDASGQCPLGSFPFNQRCVPEAPCSGGCREGQVCNIDTNNCELLPDSPAPDSGCAQECGESEMLVYADPDAMLFGQCCAVECACATLPPVPEGTWGRYSDVALGTDRLYASGYDATYGDLALGRYDTLAAQRQSLRYIDGVPQQADIVGDPAGPRQGRSAPGPNVGTHTAIALANGAPRIVYYDEDAKALKLAAYDSDAERWQLSVVDTRSASDGGAIGDVGRFTDLAVDASGHLHATYYAHRVELADGTLVSTPIYARSTVPNPQAPEDWERIAVDPVRGCGGCADGHACVLDPDTDEATCAPTADGCSQCLCDEQCVDVGDGSECQRLQVETLAIPCNGSCEDDRTCVAAADGSGTVCLSEAGDQCGGCGTNELCVSAESGPECRRATPYSQIDGLPEGNGLFTSLLLDANGHVQMAFYDRLREHLRGAMGNFTTADDLSAGFQVVPLACRPGVDMGQHADLAAGPSGLAVAFQGNDGKTLHLWRGTDFMDGDASVTTVDSGERDGGQINLVGAYASLVFANGTPYIAYADQTYNDLLIAQPVADESWQRHTILSDGAYGSFAQLVVGASATYVVSYLRQQEQGAGDASRLVVKTVDLEALP